MGLADALGMGDDSASTKGKKAKVEVTVAPAFDHFANEVFKAAHQSDPGAFADALRAAIHACLDEYEQQDTDNDGG